MQEMLISGILIWIPYHLINEKTIVNIIVIGIDAQLCTIMHLLVPLASSQVFSVLILGPPRWFPPIHGDPHARTWKIIGIGHVMRRS